MSTPICTPVCRSPSTWQHGHTCLPVVCVLVLLFLPAMSQSCRVATPACLFLSAVCSSSAACTPFMSQHGWLACHVTCYQGTCAKAHISMPAVSQCWPWHTSSCTPCVPVPHPGALTDLIMCLPCPRCLYLLFPSPGILCMPGTHVCTWDVFHHWHVVTQAHHVLASPPAGTSTPVCLPAVPCTALCHVAVWALLFAHLLCSSNLRHRHACLLRDVLWRWHTMSQCHHKVAHACLFAPLPCPVPPWGVADICVCELVVLSHLFVMSQPRGSLGMSVCTPAISWHCYVFTYLHTRCVSASPCSSLLDVPVPPYANVHKPIRMPAMSQCFWHRHTYLFALVPSSNITWQHKPPVCTPAVSQCYHMVAQACLW